MLKRQDVLKWLESKPEVSVLIVGGGVNGIGTLRDLALQGVDVLLVEKDDYCSGSSAASSHMVHGGIRYLENGEFRLVREAVQERNRLIKNAPQYVDPLPTVIPIFKWVSGLFNAPLKFLGWLDRPAERGAVVIKAGLIMYDAYTGAERTVPRHEFHLRGESLKRHPKLNPEIACTAKYYDAAMNSPERICIEMLDDTMRESEQARAINYMPAVASKDGWVTLRDGVSGEEYQVKPQIVINAAGPWIDFANRNLGKETRYIGGTKGSHLVVDNPELRKAIGNHEFFFENKDGRIVLLYPYEEKVLIGTSDIRVDDPEDVICTDEEIDYFLGMVDKVFPSVYVDRSQIVFTFSGVRPLPYQDANTTGQISRDHSAEVMEPDATLPFPVISLVGGKWTSFRAFSEHAADKALALLGKQRQASTANLPIGGGREYPKESSARRAWLQVHSRQSRQPEERVHVLFDRYGTRASQILDYLDAGEDRPLTHKPDFSEREIAFLIEEEQVVNLRDLLLRRSKLAMLGHVNGALLRELTQILGQTLGWSQEEMDAEFERAQSYLAEKHRVRVSEDTSAPELV
jgi:glycerol-3-phosphate dehydrogenase